MSSWNERMKSLTLLGPLMLTVACTSPESRPRPSPAAPAAPAVAPAPTGASEVEEASTAVLATPAVTAAPAAQQLAARARGIDVSHYQPTVDWERVKTSTSFVFIKATDSTGVVDPRFASHWSGAKKVGLPRGAYHFFHPKHDVDQQVALFTRHLKSDPGELHPVVDVEEFRTEYQAFTCEQLAGMLQRFSQGVEKALGRKPMIYTNHQTWQMSFCDHPYFVDHPLWLAQYTNHATEPKLPPGWKRWLFWQYSESGTVPGIPGAVDQSYFNGSAQELMALSQPQASAD
ncbi:glycoside hydrolase family 25 protein [Archangium violaceum]|uniref:glycoside hydrolase family 25 protein n=1 Tax=Archangium violaceum TaxID=83451 RepID=UPI000698AEB6|nr:GH25 family lysozyme [Archangium violaceum]